MTRAANGPGNSRRHKKVIKMAKGFRGRGKSCFRTAIQRVEKSLQYAYRDRRVKKRTFRSLWIQRINAGAREHGLSYSVFINGLKKAEIDMDRKVLAWMAMNDKDAFGVIVSKAQAALK